MQIDNARSNLCRIIAIRQPPSMMRIITPRRSQYFTRRRPQRQASNPAADARIAARAICGVIFVGEYRQPHSFALSSAALPNVTVGQPPILMVLRHKIARPAIAVGNYQRAQSAIIPNYNLPHYHISPANPNRSSVPGKACTASSRACAAARSSSANAIRRLSNATMRRCSGIGGNGILLLAK